MKKRNGIFKAKDLYFALCFLETGQEINSFKIYENEENSKEIRFGPLKISALDNNNIIDKILLNEKNKEIKNSLEIKEINYLNNIKKTANTLFNANKSILKTLFISRKKLHQFLFKSNQNRILYKNIFTKIIFYLYKKNEYNLDKLYNSWSVFNNNFYNDNKTEKFKLYFKNPNYKIISNISSIVQQYNYVKHLDSNNIIYYDPENTRLCAYHIRKITNIWIRSAWHCHSILNDKIIYSAFKENFDVYKKKYFNLFHEINYQPWKNYNEEIKNIISGIIPKKEEYVDFLEEGYIVGLYYKNSNWHTSAFFEAAVDKSTYHYVRWGENIQTIANYYNCTVEDIIKLNNITDKNTKLNPGEILVIKNNKNNYYVSKGSHFLLINDFTRTKKKLINIVNNLHHTEKKFKSNNRWDPAFFINKVRFKPNFKIFNNKFAFAFNTHVGIITKIGGKLMVLHYIYSKIHLTPIDSLTDIGCNIMWVINLNK